VFSSLTPIRDDDIYGGYRVSLNAKYDTLITPLSIDVSTGDAITPNPILFSFNEIFFPEKSFELWAYNIETVLAEKIETILRRSVFNTRPRDFYDTYILATTQEYDKAVFAEALSATAKHRGTEQQISNTDEIMRIISQSKDLRAMWDKYRKQFSYAKDIEFDAIVDLISDLVVI
jgi:predicted nucleotidyltransferase component of viral defense system